MSDPDSPLTPAQDEAVRAHLAAARHTDPAPADVVARLDATLASLQSERLGEAETPAPVVTLASRRRRRLATALMGAAAAVVLAVGLGEVLPGVLGSGGDSQTASESAGGGSTSSLEEDSSTADSSTPAEDAEAYGSDAAPEAQRRSTKRGPAAGTVEQPPALTSDSPLRPQVADLWRGHLLSSHLPPARCPVPSAGDADQRDALFDGEPATIVFPRPAGDFQRVAVYLCGADEPVRSTRLPLP